jgi:hypothetical protein
METMKAKVVNIYTSIIMIGSYYLKVTSIGIKGSNCISKLAWNTPFGIMFYPIP